MSTTIKVEASVKIPSIPNFLRYDVPALADDAIPIADGDDALPLEYLDELL